MAVAANQAAAFDKSMLTACRRTTHPATIAELYELPGHSARRLSAGSTAAALRAGK